jgi:hypothetical protein
MSFVLQLAKKQYIGYSGDTDDPPNPNSTAPYSGGFDPSDVNNIPEGLTPLSEVDTYLKSAAFQPCMKRFAHWKLLQP